MIYGFLGNIKKAKQLFEDYYQTAVEEYNDLVKNGRKQFLKKGEAITDEYGRQVYDWDGTAMKTQDVRHYYTDHILNTPMNPELTIYCQAGSAAYKYAKENGIKYAKWDI